MRLSRGQIAIFRKYAGDEDGFVRVATPDERNAMTGVDWAELNALAQSMGLVRAGLTSVDFEQDTLARLRAIAEDEDAATALKEALSGR